MGLLGVEIEIDGKIVWKKQDEVEKDIYQYGIEFKIADLYRTELIKVLNELSVRLNKKIRIDRSTMCTEVNMARCLRSRM